MIVETGIKRVEIRTEYVTHKVLKMNTPPVILILIFFSATTTKSLSLSLQDNCNCNPNGVETEGCDASGQCHCKCDIQGLKCTECTDFHYGFPNCSTKCKLYWHTLFENNSKYLIDFFDFRVEQLKNWDEKLKKNSFSEVTKSQFRINAMISQISFKEQSEFKGVQHTCMVEIQL